MDAQMRIGSMVGKTTISSRDGQGPEQRRRPASRGYRGEASAATPDPDIHPADGLELTPKRLYDVLLAFCGLVALSPLMAVVGALIKISDGGKVFYRQLRVGRGGEEFWIYKFRTMVPAGDKAGPSVTKGGDSRITRIGWILRKTKLDELPQLLNVLLGDMSLVGPRPEVPRYVRHYTPEQRTILSLKPGITDLASLCFRDEEALLANADNLEEFYIKHCIPRKMQLNRDYSRRANLLTDTWIILQTLCPYRLGVLVCYGSLLAVSYWLACGLASNFAPPQLSTIEFGQELGLVLALQLVCLTWRNQCNGLLSYFSFPELKQLGASLIGAASGLMLWSFASGGGPALNIILIDALVAFCVMSGFRTLLRRWRERQAGEEQEDVRPTRVGIIGAGSTGAQLALELTENRRFGRMVVAFFDDDFHKWQKSIHDVPVAGMPECLLDGWQEKLDEVVIAMPEANRDRVREIENLLSKTRLKFYSVSCLAGFPDRRQAA
jgi:lipopolysaccharide/colanic/teichoic acid biosynthesis glycosyltransferase